MSRNLSQLIFVLCRPNPTAQSLPLHHHPLLRMRDFLKLVFLLLFPIFHFFYFPSANFATCIAFRILSRIERSLKCGADSCVWAAFLCFLHLTIWCFDRFNLALLFLIHPHPNRWGRRQSTISSQLLLSSNTTVWNNWNQNDCLDCSAISRWDAREKKKNTWTEHDMKLKTSNNSETIFIFGKQVAGIFRFHRKCSVANERGGEEGEEEVLRATWMRSENWFVRVET